MNRNRLFFASCVGLVATAMCFGVRADIMDALAQEFHLTNLQLGWINGTAFWGFTLSMLIGGQLCDLIGMKRLIVFAFIGHVVGVATTIFAGGFIGLFCGTLAIGLANGVYESATNPLTATLFPDHKTERLNRLHVWFPGGIVIGGLAAYMLDHAGFGWRVKMATILIPTIAYGALFLREQLPVTERVQHKVSTGHMYWQVFRPGFLLIVLCMMMTGATELGTNQWIPRMLTQTAHVSGILILVWITGLMAVGRAFAGVIVRRIAPTSLLMLSTILAGCGLFILGFAQTPVLVVVGATVFAVGVCYCWPTLYGIASERFPAGGALALAMMGGAGMLSNAVVVPGMGRLLDLHGAAYAFKTVSVLPLIVTVIFALIWLYDHKRGGYRVVQLEGGTKPELVSK